VLIVVFLGVMGLASAAMWVTLLYLSRWDQARR
jgi:hypothetical protein